MRLNPLPEKMPGSIVQLPWHMREAPGTYLNARERPFSRFYAPTSCFPAYVCFWFELNQTGTYLYRSHVGLFLKVNFARHIFLIKYAGEKRIVQEIASYFDWVRKRATFDSYISQDTPHMNELSITVFLLKTNDSSFCTIAKYKWRSVLT